MPRVASSTSTLASMPYAIAIRRSYATTSTIAPSTTAPGASAAASFGASSAPADAIDTMPSMTNASPTMRPALVRARGT